MGGGMEHIVIDAEGASRGALPTLADARDWAHALQRTDPDLLAELLIERYRPDGTKVGESEWADDFLRALNESIVPFEPADGRSVVLRADFLRLLAVGSIPRLSWSGTGRSSQAAFFRSHGAATETRSRIPAGRAGWPLETSQSVAP
jgi:hypothetical protein